MDMDIDHVLEGDLEWLHGDADVAATARMLHAIDTFGHHARTRERARTNGLGQVILLLIGVAMTLGMVMTLNDLVAGAVRGIEHGL